MCRCLVAEIRDCHVTECIHLQGHSKQRAAADRMKERTEWFLLRKQEFDLENNIEKNSSKKFPSICKANMDQALLLSEWLVNKSWTRCFSCQCLLPNPLLPKANVLKRSLPTCSCIKSVLPIPSYSMFDSSLTCLSVADQNILSPFLFVSGPYKGEKHGYRVKTSGFDLETKSVSVWDFINEIHDTELKQRLINAYTHLMTRTDSHYSHFIQEHSTQILEPKYFFNRAIQIPFIETAIWPVLYHRNDFFESYISQSHSSKHSKKKTFFTKSIFFHIGLFFIFPNLAIPVRKMDL